MKQGIRNLKKSSKYAAFLAKTWYNGNMGEQLVTEEKLNKLPKETIIMLLLSQNDNFRALSEQSAVIQKQNEQLAILTQQRFGRRSEKNLPINGQPSLDLDNPGVLNEAEILTEKGFCEESLLEEAIPKKTPRPKGKRAVDLSGIKTTAESHYLDESFLDETFFQGWHQLADEVCKELKRIPASYEAVEHHIGVCARRKGQGILHGLSVGKTVRLHKCLLVGRRDYERTCRLSAEQVSLWKKGGDRG